MRPQLALWGFIHLSLRRRGRHLPACPSKCSWPARTTPICAFCFTLTHHPSTNPARFCPHSVDHRFDPTTGADRVFLKALRPIGADEEVFVSYGSGYCERLGLWGPGAWGARSIGGQRLGGTGAKLRG